MFNQFVRLVLHVSVGIISEKSTCDVLDDKVDVGHKSREMCESVCADREASFFVLARDESGNCSNHGCRCMCMLINSSECVVNDNPDYDLYDASGGVYLKWSSWSECPLLCESLNVNRLRRRKCATSDCRGDILQKKKCDEQYCTGKERL